MKRALHSRGATRSSHVGHAKIQSIDFRQDDMSAVIRSSTGYVLIVFNSTQRARLFNRCCLADPLE